MTTASVSISEYVQWLQDINTTATTAFSDFVRSMRNVANDVKAGVVTEAAAQKTMADFFYDQYRQYETSARSFAQRAVATGDSAAAELFDRYATQFSSVAEQRAALGDAAWLDRRDQKAFNLVRVSSTT